MERVRLLWTGGWDSSFRLLQLTLVEGRPVQPVYVVNPERDSMLLEIRAMETIRDAVLERTGDRELIAPTRLVVRTQFPPSRELVERYEAIKGQVHIGTQYLYLAAVVEANGWQGIELSMESYPAARSELQKLIFDDRWQLNDSRAAELFRCFSFPVLRLSKEDMAREAERQGFRDLLSASWFCHTPVGGRPCGTCRPCSLAYDPQVRFASPLVARPALLWRRARRAGGRRVAERMLERVRGSKPGGAG